MIHFPVEHAHLAGGAQAMTAGMGKVNAGAEGRIENGLPLLDRYARAERLYRQFVGHGIQGFGNKALGNGVIMRI